MPSMEDSIEKRKNSEEAKYKLDAEMQFKAKARCNKLLGLWAAGRMGIRLRNMDRCHLDDPEARP